MLRTSIRTAIIPIDVCEPGKGCDFSGSWRHLFVLLFFFHTWYERSIKNNSRRRKAVFHTPEYINTPYICFLNHCVRASLGL